MDNTYSFSTEQSNGNNNVDNTNQNFLIPNFNKTPGNEMYTEQNQLFQNNKNVENFNPAGNENVHNQMMPMMNNYWAMNNNFNGNLPIGGPYSMNMFQANQFQTPPNLANNNVINMNSFAQQALNNQANFMLNQPNTSMANMGLNRNKPMTFNQSANPTSISTENNTMGNGMELNLMFNPNNLAMQKLVNESQQFNYAKQQNFLGGNPPNLLNLNTPVNVKNEQSVTSPVNLKLNLANSNYNSGNPYAYLNQQQRAQTPGSFTPSTVNPSSGGDFATGGDESFTQKKTPKSRNTKIEDSPEVPLAITEASNLNQTTPTNSDLNATSNNEINKPGGLDKPSNAKVKDTTTQSEISFHILASDGDQLYDISSCKTISELPVDVSVIQEQCLRDSSKFSHYLKQKFKVLKGPNVIEGHIAKGAGGDMNLHEFFKVVFELGGPIAISNTRSWNKVKERVSPHEDASKMAYRYKSLFERYISVLFYFLYPHLNLTEEKGTSNKGNKKAKLQDQGNASKVDTGNAPTPSSMNNLNANAQQQKQLNVAKILETVSSNNFQTALNNQLGIPNLAGGAPATNLGMGFNPSNRPMQLPNNFGQMNPSTQLSFNQLPNMANLKNMGNPGAVGDILPTYMRPNVRPTFNQNLPSQQPLQQNQPQPAKLPEASCNYVPMARKVDTYGGIDLSILQRTRSKPTVSQPSAYDIPRLTMMLKSPLLMERSDALMQLVELTYHVNGLDLGRCSYLLETVADLLEECYQTLRDEFGYLEVGRGHDAEFKPLIDGFVKDLTGGKFSCSKLVKPVTMLLIINNLSFHNPQLLSQYTDLIETVFSFNKLNLCGYPGELIEIKKYLLMVAYNLSDHLDPKFELTESVLELCLEFLKYDSTFYNNFVLELVNKLFLRNSNLEELKGSMVNREVLEQMLKTVVTNFCSTYNHGVELDHFEPYYQLMLYLVLLPNLLILLDNLSGNATSIATSEVNGTDTGAVNHDLVGLGATLRLVLSHLLDHYTLVTKPGQNGGKPSGADIHMVEILIRYAVEALRSTFRMGVPVSSSYVLSLITKSHLPDHFGKLLGGLEKLAEEEI